MSKVNFFKIDGISTTIEIRKRLKMERIPIVALSAHALSEQIDICRQVGMQDFLPKPIQLIELKKALEIHGSQSATLCRNELDSDRRQQQPQQELQTEK